MEKVITISGKNYSMRASALTQFLYKNDTGRNFLNDLQKLVEFENENSNFESNMKILDEVTILMLKIAYTMIKQANKDQVKDYESFVDGIDNLYDDPSWIEQVIELACSPISGRLQTNK